METEVQLKDEDVKVEAYDRYRAQLSQLKEENNKAVFDYRTKKGNKEARSHIAKIRRVKGALEKDRKEAKAWSLAYGRRVDSLAAEIENELDDMIEVHALPLREIEEEEQKRVDHIMGLINLIAKFRDTDFDNSDQVMQVRYAVDKISVTQEEYQEFYSKALEEKQATLHFMDVCFRDLLIEEERASELQRQKEEAEARAREEREKRLAQEAAERARREEEERARAEREAAHRREIELKMAAERAEQERVNAIKRAEEAEARREKEAKEAAERAERMKLAEEQRRKEAEARARQAEIQRQKEEKEREEEEKRLREEDRQHKRKINTAALSALIENGIPEDVAKQAITLIAKKMVPNVSINY